MRGLLPQLRTHVVWSRKTFGEGRRTGGLTQHIVKELEEIRLAPSDVVEWIDVAILALDGAWRCVQTNNPQAKDPGLAVVKALYKKMGEVRLRDFPKPVSEDEPCEHVR